MTPAARLQAAIEVLDRVIAGDAAEKALTNWARGARYAGSKDRAAVRDHVFDVLRMWRSTAALGGGETGRARVLGLLRAQGIAPETLFTGEGHAPAPLAPDDGTGHAPQGYEGWDLPDWIAERLVAGHGDAAAGIAEALRQRAPVFLRANLLKTDVDHAIATLAEAGIEAQPHPLAPTALQVTEGARKIANSAPFTDGLVELQDAASQAVCAMLPLEPGLRVLDYCAGGGGKSLAMAARTRGTIEAHDANPRRMSDLPARAARAGADIKPVDRPRGQYDLVLCDVPCSGSGAWRRSPEGKWRLNATDLVTLRQVQADILETCAQLVSADGVLAYATCSVLAEENDNQINAFLGRNPDWSVTTSRQFLPEDGGDGFFVACLTRKDATQRNY
ncbi:RsmB/NOP family class I SAM-dependent RNA methyltransferase [Tropicibacter alexandrii]|uniref:RsmB/NOP family class I SAM-dependent RNA methyltransferase n=1 Tax=Tropicibacter alexandrii TaxID=2267683 RepID=UPI000EF4FD4B|nr:RsmB/NOP family class I SAM-dependent RNA methyltransferase [Tropicibacter alexandrii]